MKRIPEDDPRTEAHDQLPSDRAELDGLVELGMKREALRLARRSLKNPALTAQTFNQALNALLTLEGKLKPWRSLVESAYARLPGRGRAAARFWMISFYSSCSDNEGVLKLAPKEFTGEFGLLELGFVTEAALDLSRTELVKKLAGFLPRAIGEAGHALTRSRLQLCLAECLARESKWAEAIAVLEAVLPDETHSQNAVTAIVEIHAVRALLALRKGFQLIEQFKQDFDPATGIMLPGNDDAVQEGAAKEFRRLQIIFEKVFSEKRREELGLL